jgi:hypothetical protein
MLKKKPLAPLHFICLITLSVMQPMRHFPYVSYIPTLTYVWVSNTWSFTRFQWLESDRNGFIVKYNWKISFVISYTYLFFFNIIDPSNKEKRIEDKDDISKCVSSHSSRIGKDSTVNPDFRKYILNYVEEKQVIICSGLEMSLDPLDNSKSFYFYF